MIGAVLLMLAPVTAAPPELADQQIVVIGRKLNGWRGHAKKRDGAWVCQTKRSTGDGAIDQIGCNAMLTCFAEFEPQLQAVVASNLDKKLRQQRFAALFKDVLTPCVKLRRADGIAELAAQRSGQ